MPLLAGWKHIYDAVNRLSCIYGMQCTQVPLILRWGEETYRDGIDLTAKEFYKRLTHSKIPPATSIPSPGVFAETYDKLAEKTHEILVITLSSRLSGTYNVALSSTKLMKKRCRVEVIDSTSASMAQGFIAMKAARAAKAGDSLDRVIEVTRQTIPRVDFLSTFDTLEYLKRGGRIGKAQAFLGSMLKIHPLITLKNGVVEPAGKTRSREHAIDRLVDFVMSYTGIEELAIQSATTPREAEALSKRISCKFPRGRIYFSRPTPVIGAHTGPGLMLVAVLGDKN